MSALLSHSVAKDTKYASPILVREASQQLHFVAAITKMVVPCCGQAAQRPCRRLKESIYEVPQGSQWYSCA